MCFFKPNGILQLLYSFNQKQLANLKKFNLWFFQLHFSKTEGLVTAAILSKSTETNTKFY